VTIEERVDSVSLDECRANYTTQHEISTLLLSLVSALQHIWEHESRLVHRDLKPDNILIRPSGEVVIIDLGIVREEGQAGFTNTYAAWGPCTPTYASPEQATNSKLNISFKSDFFSLGTLAYELATGSNPFGHPTETVEAVLDRVVNYEPPELNEVSDISEEFAGVVGKMMAKQPYQRYRRIEDLAAVLESFV